MVLYRKYRPKTFSNLVGQEYIIKTLTNSLKMGTFAHAYLFAGPKGTGKTTIARLLSKAVNCENRKNKEFEPCNKCKACEEINKGQSLDLIEIDAASNRGIDEIRELRQGIKFSPTRLKYKVFIIDEVHMLTREAFNALLKTLEEPPEHAIFILATTELHKVLPTIISRCQFFQFRKFNLKELVKNLTFISNQEKIKIEKKALQVIALNAQGDSRDAISLLDQITFLENKKITSQEVIKLLGISHINDIIEIIKVILKKQTKNALLLINKLEQKGIDLSQFAKSIIDYLRKILLLKQNSEKTFINLVAPELTKEQINAIIKLGKNINEKGLLDLLDIFIKAEYNMKSAVSPQLPLEMAIVESCIGE